VEHYLKLLSERKILSGQGGTARDERPQQEIKSFDKSH
jgi:hypothetical protein